MFGLDLDLSFMFLRLSSKILIYYVKSHYSYLLLTILLPREGLSRLLVESI
jgi:hypothetical protein